MSPSANSSDRGAILPLVLVVTVIMSVVVAAIATYTTTTLRFGQVVEQRAGRVAAAQGAMDDTIEQLALQTPLCSTVGAGGIDVPFPEQVNGATVSVNCRVIGTALPPADGWAIVVTNVGAPNDGSDTFEFTLGGEPEISGPVFLQDPNRSSYQKPTTIKEGDLFHPDDACAESDPSDPGIQFASSTFTAPNLGFFPSTRGPYCINRDWDELFGTGPVVSPEVATLTADTANWNPSYSVDGSCRVFEPGYYTGSLDLGSSNYFKSGTYVFDGLGLVTLKNKAMTVGQTLRPEYPAVPNTGCDTARTNDTDTEGATVYIRGNTQFESESNSGLEVSGRRQGPSIVAMHVLSSTLGYSSPLITASNGAKKEASLQGLLWAPENSLVFATVPTKKAAVLRGGAVVASFRGGISAAASGFVIEVATTPSESKLLLESTATDAHGSNTVRAVVDYRPSSGEVAVNSRRVID